MSEEITIEVAGVGISLTSHSPDLIHHLRQAYAFFLSSNMPSLTIDLTLTEEHYVNASSWAGLTISGDVFELSDNYLESKIDLALRIGTARVSVGGFTIGLSTLLRNMFTLLLLFEQDAVILHAAAILKAHQVYIFLGPSGSGKTTVCQLSDPYPVLSDDMVIVKHVPGSYAVFPAPCWLDMQRGDRQNRAYPIGGIFRLVQDERTYVETVSPARAMAELFTVPHIPAHLQPVQKLLHTFGNILHEVGFYELHFRKDPCFWRHIDARH